LRDSHIEGAPTRTRESVWAARVGQAEVAKRIGLGLLGPRVGYGFGDRPIEQPIGGGESVAPGPTAKLPAVLEQPEPELAPLIDAQVALAMPAAAANPDATAPSSTPPASLSCDFAVC